MRTKPSMELPSIMIWLFTAFSICEAVMATFFSWPKMSVNCIRMNSTSSSFTMRMMSSLLYLLMRRPSQFNFENKKSEHEQASKAPSL